MFETDIQDGRPFHLPQLPCGHVGTVNSVVQSLVAKFRSNADSSFKGTCLVYSSGAACYHINTSVV